MIVAFISRHAPTARQIELADEAGIELVHVGDADGFTVDPLDIIQRVQEKLPFRLAEGRIEGMLGGVVVVHAAAALRLTEWWPVGVFENGNRAAEGEPPTFEAVRLHWFDCLGKGERHGKAVGYNDGYAAGVADGRTMW